MAARITRTLSGLLGLRSCGQFCQMDVRLRGETRIVLAVENKNSKNQQPGGLLVTCLLFGLVIGFAPFEMYAAADGWGWLSRYHLNRTLTAMVVGGVIGLAIGFVLDARLRTAQQRSATIGWIWTILATGYFFYLFFRPAIQGVR